MFLSVPPRRWPNPLVALWQPWWPLIATWRNLSVIREKDLAIRGAGIFTPSEEVPRTTSSAVSCQFNPQDIRVVVQKTTAASLKRLVLLVDCLTAWKPLPNISCWVPSTVEKDNAIQFVSCLPTFMGILPTVVATVQSLVME